MAAIKWEYPLSNVKRIRTKSLLILLLVLILLTSCAPFNGQAEVTESVPGAAPVWTKQTRPTELSQEVGTRPPRGQTLILATDLLFDGWSSPLHGFGSDSSPLNLIYEPLLSYDSEQGNYVPLFAASVRFDDAGLHLALDEEKLWHDGVPVSLADIIYSLEWYQRLQVDPLLLQMTLTVEDEKHLVAAFPPTTPADRISYTMSRLYMLPRHIFFPLEQAANGDLRQLSDARLIGSGPYRLTVSDDYSVLLSLVRETDPYPRYVEIPRYGDEKSRRRATETGQADIMYGRFLRADDVTAEAGSEALYSLWLNSNRESLQNPAVRRSISRSYRRAVVAARLEVTNKKPFISYQYFGSNGAAAALDPALFREGEPHYSTSDVVRAMNAAGIRTDSQGFYRLNERSAPLELVYLNRSLYKPMVEQLQSEVGTNGFAVKLVPVDQNEYIRRRETLDFDLLLDVCRPDDQADSIDARIRDLIPLIDEADAEAVLNLNEARRLLYGNESVSLQARRELALELQRLCVVLPLDSAPYAYLNIHQGVWGSGETDFPTATDPFGREWRILYEWLKRSQGQGID